MITSTKICVQELECSIYLTIWKLLRLIQIMKISTASTRDHTEIKLTSQLQIHKQEWRMSCRWGSTRSWVLLASLSLAVCIRYQIPKNNKEIKADSKDGMYKTYSKHTIITLFLLSHARNCVCQQESGLQKKILACIPKVIIFHVFKVHRV